MNYNFCTLFDKNYLFKGLALYYSLVDYCGNFKLWILCMDEITYDTLRKLNLSKVNLIRLDEFEDPDLLAVKPTRTAGEYCWTITPSLPLFLLKKHQDLKEITYLDADLAFFSIPKPLFDEFGDDSILIIEHRFYKDIDQHIKENGKYNVQFLTFRNDKNSLECLGWWRKQCLNWCYNRHENGLIGDQAYLNDWVTRFKCVHELQYIGGGLAPWNIFNYRISKKGKNIFVNDAQLIFYHYHAFRIYSKNLFQYIVGYMSKLTKSEKELIYDPYVVYIKKAIDEVNNIDPNFNYGFEKKRIKDMLVIFLTGIRRNFNI